MLSYSNIEFRRIIVVALFLLPIKVFGLPFEQGLASVKLKFHCKKEPCYIHVTGFLEKEPNTKAEQRVKRIRLWHHGLGMGSETFNIVWQKTSEESLGDVYLQRDGDNEALVLVGKADVKTGEFSWNEGVEPSYSFIEHRWPLAQRGFLYWLGTLIPNIPRYVPFDFDEIDVELNIPAPPHSWDKPSIEP
ncbi:MAG: hypothetical protein AB8G05_07395 [Oligoflexales bacterium]